MTFTPLPGYWLEIPAGRHRVGLTREEAARLAEPSAAWFKAEGPEFSLNEGKMLGRYFEIQDETGNPAWIERYLLAWYPAREVDLPAFAIAKRPVTNALYRQFMAETGETQEPSSWHRADGNTDDDRPASGLGWWQAVAFAEWAGARLPFEAEWQRAVRGPDHHLFPWGNTHAPLGPQILSSYYPKLLPIATTRTDEGLEGALAGQPEWCADLWFPPRLIDPLEWGEEPAPLWHRVQSGSEAGKPRTIPCGVTRSPHPLARWDDTAQLRLVRADGREMPAPHRSTPRAALAFGEVRMFESRTLVPLLRELHRSRMGDDYKVEAPWELSAIGPRVAGSTELWKALCEGMLGTPAWLTRPDDWVHGPKLLACSRETIRRVPVQHGLFLWAIHYRLAADGTIRARPLVAFRMAFDKSIHRFENRFRPDEPDSALASLTPELVRVSILDAFQFYEIHADADENPFGPSP